MKSIVNSLKLFYLTAVLTLIQVLTFAQETSSGGSTTSGSSSTSSSTKINVTSDTGNWFATNWIWVVGVIVFIILLFALIGGGSSRSTTVVREDMGTGRVSRTTTVDDDL